MRCINKFSSAIPKSMPAVKAYILQRILLHSKRQIQDVLNVNKCLDKWQMLPVRTKSKIEISKIKNLCHFWQNLQRRYPFFKEIMPMIHNQKSSDTPPLSNDGYPYRTIDERNTFLLVFFKFSSRTFRGKDLAHLSSL